MSLYLHDIDKHIENGHVYTKLELILLNKLHNKQNEIDFLRDLLASYKIKIPNK